MAGAVYETRVKGLRELQRALNKVNKEMAKTVREALKEAAEPARVAAESLAFSEISNIGPTWGRIRLGTTPGTVYLAPKTRNRGGSGRPNLGIMLIEEAMLPAAEDHHAEIVERVGDAIDALGASEGF